jgi:hypothetical protein
VYVPFLVDIPFFKCILKSCFVRVISTACDSALISSIVKKWRPLNFIFNQRNREKSQGAKPGLGGKGRVRWCVVMMQQAVLLLVKFSAVFAYFHAVAIKRHSSMRNSLFGLPA